MAADAETKIAVALSCFGHALAELGDLAGEREFPSPTFKAKIHRRIQESNPKNTGSSVLVMWKEMG